MLVLSNELELVHYFNLVNNTDSFTFISAQVVSFIKILTALQVVNGPYHVVFYHTLFYSVFR